MAKTVPIPKKRQVAQAKKPSFSFEQFIKWPHLIIITVLFWFTYSQIFDSKPDLNGDNFAYFLLGQRISHGLGFTNATEITHGPHIHFSPGYPVLLSVFMKVFGEDQDTIDFMNGLMMYGSLLLLYFLVRRLTGSSALAFVTAFLTAINSHLLRSSTIMMSEVPFVFFSLLAITFFTLGVEDRKGIKSPWLYLSILMMAACYYTKTTAIAFAGAACLYLLFAKDWKRLLVVGLGFFLLILPWSIRGHRVGNSYMGQLMQVNPYKPELGNLTKATFIERVSHNFSRYISTDIPSAVLSLEANFEKAPTSYWIMGLLIIGFALWGIYRLKDFRLFFLGYIGGTMLILLIWPDAWGGIRFIEPLVPIVLFLAFYGVKELAALAVGQKNAAWMPYFFLALGLICVKPIEGLQDQAKQPMSPNYTNYFEIAKWAKANTPKDAIFSARKPDMFIYYGDRMCVGDKPSLDDKEVLDFFRKNNVDYVVIEQLGFSSTSKYLVPAVQKNMDKFEIVYQLRDPDTYLLKFKR